MPPAVIAQPMLSHLPVALALQCTWCSFPNAAPCTAPHQLSPAGPAVHPTPPLHGVSAPALQLPGANLIRSYTVPWVSHFPASISAAVLQSPLAFSFPTLTSPEAFAHCLHGALMLSSSLLTVYFCSLLVSCRKGSTASKHPAGLRSRPYACLGRERGRRDPTWRYSWVRG